MDFCAFDMTAQSPLNPSAWERVTPLLGRLLEVAETLFQGKKMAAAGLLP
jgi:hypothetical protein